MGKYIICYISKTENEVTKPVYVVFHFHLSVMNLFTELIASLCPPSRVHYIMNSSLHHYVAVCAGIFCGYSPLHFVALWQKITIYSNKLCLLCICPAVPNWLN